MLSNIITLIKKSFREPSEHEKLDKFVADHMPTSVGDVEYLIKLYDQKQHQQRSSNFSHV